MVIRMSTQEITPHKWRLKVAIVLLLWGVLNIFFIRHYGWSESFVREADSSTDTMNVAELEMVQWIPYSVWPWLAIVGFYLVTRFSKIKKKFQPK